MQLESRLLIKIAVVLYAVSCKQKWDNVYRNNLCSWKAQRAARSCSVKRQMLDMHKWSMDNCCINAKYSSTRGTVAVRVEWIIGISCIESIANGDSGRRSWQTENSSVHVDFMQQLTLVERDDRVICSMQQQLQRVLQWLPVCQSPVARHLLVDT